MLSYQRKLLGHAHLTWDIAVAWARIVRAFENSRRVSGCLIDISFGSLRPQ